jgi:diguanylate cyclase (GGDEF)-like protein
MTKAKQTDAKRSINQVSRVLIFFLVLVITFCLYATNRIVNVIDQAKQEQISQNQRLVQVTSGLIDDYINTSSRSLIPITNQKDVRSQNYPAVSKWMQWYVSQYQDCSLVAFVDAKGNVKALGVSSKLMDNDDAWKISLSNVGKFAKSMTANGLKTGNFKYSQITRSSSLLLGYPVFDYASKRIGVVVVGMDLSSFQNRIAGYYLGSANQTQLTITDEKGYTIARSAELDRYIGDVSPNSTILSKVIKNAGKNTSGTLKGEFTEGVSDTLAYSSASSVPWFVYAGVKTEFIQGKVKDESLGLIGEFLALLVMFGFGLWWIMRGSKEHVKSVSDYDSIRFNSVDPATGLWDNARFENDLLREHNRAKRYRELTSLAAIDLDNLSVYADINGEKAADDALRAVVQIVNGTIRDADSVYRNDKGEICVLLPNTDKAGAQLMANRVVKGIEEQQFAGAESLPSGGLTVSIGIATYPFDSVSIDGLLDCVNEALNTARNSEASSIEIYKADNFRLYNVG